MKKFEDFEIELENEVYYICISTPSNENWGGLIVTFATQSNINSDNETEWNEMHLSNKEMLESVLIIFFGFEENDIKEALESVKEEC